MKGGCPSSNVILFSPVENPLRHGYAVPPLPKGEARGSFRCRSAFLAPPLGELSAARLTERAACMNRMTLARQDQIPARNPIGKPLETMGRKARCCRVPRHSMLDRLQWQTSGNAGTAKPEAKGPLRLYARSVTGLLCVRNAKKGRI